MGKLDALVEKLREARAASRREGKDALKEAFEEFFQAHPYAKAIVWTQYTPYFNDGDACTFGIHEFELRADLSGFAEDVVASVEQDAGGADEDEDELDPFDVPYGYGTDDVIGVLTSLEDTEDNRKYNYRNLKLRSLTPEEKKLVDDFDRLEAAYHELSELAKDVIGDHVKVVVTRDGIRTSEYSHD